MTTRLDPPTKCAMGNTDLTSIESIFIVVAFILTGFILAIFYYFFRYSLKDGVDRAELELPSEAPSPVGDPSQQPIASVPKTTAGSLEKTKAHLWGRIRGLFQSSVAESDIFEQIEEILLTSDMGPRTVQRLTEYLDETLSGEHRLRLDSIRNALSTEMERVLAAHERFPGQSLEETLRSLCTAQPTVLMVVGVNGAGKTTTIGKLAQSYSRMGKKALIVAADTFRAAAQTQLEVWAQRAGVEIFAPEGVTDPAAVAYSGLEKAKGSGVEVVIIDTAGRLHTQSHLMDELKKIKRVLAKLDATAPHETILVLDANSGQNALVQAQMFDEALDVTGVVLTKLDGTAKGGVALGLSYERELPLLFLGVGEKSDDLKPFDPQDFVAGIFGEEPLDTKVHDLVH